MGRGVSPAGFVRKCRKLGAFALVYGVATFYHFFSFAPQGRHTCVVCTGTACYVKGADALLEAVGQQLATI